MEKIYVSNDGLMAHVIGGEVVAVGCDCVINVSTPDELAHEAYEDCENCGKEPKAVPVPDLDAMDIKWNGTTYEAK